MSNEVIFIIGCLVIVLLFAIIKQFLKLFSLILLVVCVLIWFSPTFFDHVKKIVPQFKKIEKVLPYFEPKSLLRKFEQLISKSSE